MYYQHLRQNDVFIVFIVCFYFHFSFLLLLWFSKCYFDVGEDNGVIAFEPFTRLIPFAGFFVVMLSNVRLG
jgi:hypothetical protein